MEMPFLEQNRSIFKLSPDKPLQAEQKKLKNRLDAFLCSNKDKNHACFIIYGDAGTGKSVFLNRVFMELQQHARADSQHPLFGLNNALLVNHPEMLKAYKNATESIPTLKKKDYERPTTFINQHHKTGNIADIVFVDEAHLLLTGPDRYNHFFQDNHLEEIMQIARLVVLVFDEKQVLKAKSCWEQKMLNELLQDYPVETFTLQRQFRMNVAKQHAEWIEQFCQGKLRPIPLSTERFELRPYSSAQQMYEDIQQHNQYRGLSRMLATYDYPYRLDGHDYFIIEGDFCLRWDRAKPHAKDPWAEREDTIEEVGSVYTIQGFDLNYVGLILGPSVTWDEASQQIVLHPDKYEDKAAFNGLGARDDAQEIKQKLMWNSINVLMTRAINGLYIYAHDPVLRQKLTQAKIQAG